MKNFLFLCEEMIVRSLHKVKGAKKTLKVFFYISFAAFFFLLLMEFPDGEKSGKLTSP